MAKKKGRRKRRKTRRPKPGPERNTTLVPKLRAQGLLKDQLILHEPEGFEKTSAMILELIEPYIELTADRESFEALVMFAIMAWNISMLPDGELQAMIDEVVEENPTTKSGSEEIADFLGKLIERKHKLFAYNTRTISGYELAETKDGYNLSVVSSIGIPKDLLSKGSDHEK